MDSSPSKKRKKKMTNGAKEDEKGDENDDADRTNDINNDNINAAIINNVMNGNKTKKQKKKGFFMNSEENVLLDHRGVLHHLGFYSSEFPDKIRLRESVERRFNEIVHHKENTVPSMNIFQFIADCTSRGHNTRYAKAGFRLLVDSGEMIWGEDLCKVLCVQLEQYLAFRLLLPPHYPMIGTDYLGESESSNDNVEEALFHWQLRFIFYMYDTNGSGHIEKSQIQSLVTDLFQLNTQSGTLADILWSQRDTSGFSFRSLLKKENLDAIRDSGCSLGSLLQLPVSTLCNSVLDTRAITSRIPAALVMPPPRCRVASIQHGRHSLNTEEVTLPESMRPLSDWRGLLVNRSSTAFEIANNVIANAHRMMLKTYSENDVQDSEWMVAPVIESSSAENAEVMPHSNANLQCLYELLAGPSDEPFSIELDVKPMLHKIASLCSETKRVLSSQPNVVHVPMPCKVFGDIHGQLRDLLLLFREYGFPNNKGGDVDAVKYIFDGDFVDRGSHQVEVVVLLFALKVAYPGCVYLLRGNHEMREQNIAMGESGFIAACRKMFVFEYADRLFALIHMVFDWLPLAAVVAKQVLVLHGGIGDGSWAISDLESLQRPIRNDSKEENDGEYGSLVVQVLWSDPTEGHDDANPGVHCNERGKGIIKFSNNITQVFCERNKLSHIIRGHQYVAKGYKIVHGGRVITVFSARNYFDRVQNDSAIILISEDEEGNIRIKPKTLMRRLPDKPL